MKKVFGSVLSLCLAVFFTIFFTGCTEKVFKPESVLEVPSVSPYELHTNATDTQSLPTVDITVNLLNSVPCNLKSYSIIYKTQYGENISQLTVSSIPKEQKMSAGTSNIITIKPYTARVVALAELSSSQIFPLQAEMILIFEDYNGNTINKSAHCLIYAPE